MVGVGKDVHSTGILHARARGIVYPESLSLRAVGRPGGWEVSVVTACSVKKITEDVKFDGAGFHFLQLGIGSREPDRRMRRAGRETQRWDLCQVASPEKASTTAQGQGLLTLPLLDTVALGTWFPTPEPKGHVQAMAVTLGKRQAAEGRDCLVP